VLLNSPPSSPTPGCGVDALRIINQYDVVRKEDSDLVVRGFRAASFPKGTTTMNDSITVRSLDGETANQQLGEVLAIINLGTRVMNTFAEVLSDASITEARYVEFAGTASDTVFSGNKMSRYGWLTRTSGYASHGNSQTGDLRRFVTDALTKEGAERIKAIEGILSGLNRLMSKGYLELNRTFHTRVKRAASLFDGRHHQARLLAQTTLPRYREMYAAYAETYYAWLQAAVQMEQFCYYLELQVLRALRTLEEILDAERPADQSMSTSEVESKNTEPVAD
jgi:hypothetical protein